MFGQGPWASRWPSKDIKPTFFPNLHTTLLCELIPSLFHLTFLPIGLMGLSGLCLDLCADTPKTGYEDPLLNIVCGFYRVFYFCVFVFQSS